jgi:hypothetical protein
MQKHQGFKGLMVGLAVLGLGVTVTDAFGQGRGGGGGTPSCSNWNLVCPDVWDPVICDDGQVYSNQCYADRACATGCEPYGGGGIVVASTGGRDFRLCSNWDIYCLDVWDPVECDDGNVYSNQCYADRACATGCEPLGGVIASEPIGGGPIGGTITVCENWNIYCLDVWDPVVCDDGQVYSNQCYADRACATGCEPLGGVIASIGLGGGTITTCNNWNIYCLDVWDPVVCDDGQVYSNQCYADRACATGCEPQGGVIMGGPIGGGNWSPCGNGNIYCLDVWDPVVCDDGQVYSNQCYADRACATGCEPLGGVIMSEPDGSRKVEVKGRSARTSTDDVRTGGTR